MESLDNTTKHSKSFIKHVFYLDEDSKADLLNIIQYALISIVPIVIVNKLMQKYVPEADDEKGSLELAFESCFQIVIIFSSLFFIHKIATFFPTYSGVDYPTFSVIYIVLSTLMVVLSLQTKLGEKVSILTDRVVELWEGNKEDDKNKKGKKQQQKKQPQQQQQPSQNNMAISQSLYGDSQSTSIHNLPIQQEPLPDYNKMYQNTPTPVVEPSIPGSSMTGGFGGGIMAANEAFGGMYGTGF
jgi:hypothetical protein